MHHINQIYINGAFVTPHGEELFDLFNPATGQRIGQVRLANEQDALEAISAAKRAFTEFSQSPKEVRIGYLKRMHAAVESVEDELTDAIIEEYGAPLSRARWMARHAASVL
ncbi:aldehyde dehydrogenase family protein, partial [Cupriavidus pinatubonensis]